MPRAELARANPRPPPTPRSAAVARRSPPPRPRGRRARRRRNGRARPTALAPSARHLATSTPSRTPPDAIAGSSGAAATAARSASAVGRPQSAKAPATAPAARVAPALDQRPVRPARAGDVDRGDARVAQRHDVGGIEAEADLLDHHRPRREPRHARGDPGEHAAEVRLALGLDRLLQRVEVHGQAVGVEQLDQPLRALRPGGIAQLRARRGSRAAAAGARRDRAGRSAAARDRRAAAAPSRAPARSRASAAARASRRLISAASAVPPVMAETTSGAVSRAPSSSVSSETLARSRSGSARWRSRTRSSPVPARVLDAALGGDPQMLRLAMAGRGHALGTEQARVRTSARENVHRARRKPRSSSLRAWRAGVGGVQQHDAQPHLAAADARDEAAPGRDGVAGLDAGHPAIALPQQRIVVVE